MGLVRKPRGQADLDQRDVGSKDLLLSMLDPDPAQVIADGTVFELAKDARQMGWVNPHRLGQLA
jgi:hypothetical protein